MKKHKNSSQGKVEFVLLKEWSLPVFKQPDHNLKLKATTRQELRKNLIASVFMGIVTVLRHFWSNGILFSFLFLSKS